MSAPEPDILRRGQAIFDRLRNAGSDSEEPDVEVVPDPAGDAVLAPVPDGGPDPSETAADLTDTMNEDGGVADPAVPSDVAPSEASDAANGTAGPDTERTVEGVSVPPAVLSASPESDAVATVVDGTPEPQVQPPTEYADPDPAPGESASAYQTEPEEVRGAAIEPAGEPVAPAPSAPATAADASVAAATAESVVPDPAENDAPSQALTETAPEPVVVPDPPSVAEIVGEAAALAPTPTSEAVAEPVAAPDPGARKPHPASLRPLPRVIAVANQKGGVGKTTTTVNLGAGLAELGFRVLIVDLDPQGNATTGLGINQRNLESSVYDVLLHDVALDDCIEPTSVRNLFVAPATIDLAGADIELVPAFSRELRLRRAIESLDDSFDFTIIDCPPSLGLITVNGLAAASEVIVPIQCEYYALEGLGQLLKNVNLVTGNLNPQLEVSAIVLTMYDSRTKLAEQVAEEVRHHFGERVCRMVIPRTVRLSEAPSFGQPILTFDPTSRGAVAYRELAKEVSGGKA